MSDNKFESLANEICENIDNTFISYISKGAFKETYKIEDEEIFYALKIFDPATGHPERSQREIEALESCNLNSIAKVQQSGLYVSPNNQEYTYVIEEFLDGGTLTDQLNTVNTLDETSVLTISKTIIEALDHLRELRLVHRDIKSDNVMFRKGDDLPVLVDFGLVRNLSEPALTATFLTQGPGTPLYSPPEQLNNEKHSIDWRSDQFSVGLLLGICFTGTHPFYSDGMNHLDIITKIATKEKVSSSFIDAVKDTPLQYIIKMLEPWPIRRHATPEKLLNIIEEYI